MNLQPLFETQKKLMDRIGYNEPDRFEKTILALLVEVGECANEWRGFKYWSKDQEPRTFSICQLCSGLGWYYVPYTLGEKAMCNCVNNPKNPLLEEYVDGLHFVLQLGIELGVAHDYHLLGEIQPNEWNVTKAFNGVFQRVLKISATVGKTKLPKAVHYDFLLESYINLGEMLGFTWEQIEQAYMDKNKVNHERQLNGY